jgi:hypothetical protein
MNNLIRQLIILILIVFICVSCKESRISLSEMTDTEKLHYYSEEYCSEFFYRSYFANKNANEVLNGHFIVHHSELIDQTRKTYAFKFEDEEIAIKLHDVSQKMVDRIIAIDKDHIKRNGYSSLRGPTDPNHIHVHTIIKNRDEYLEEVDFAIDVLKKSASSYFKTCTEFYSKNVPKCNQMNSRALHKECGQRLFGTFSTAFSDYVKINGSKYGFVDFRKSQDLNKNEGVTKFEKWVEDPIKNAHLFE